MLAPAAFPSFFLALAGFVLLLIVTLSVPIIHDVYLLRVTGTEGGVAVSADLGVFGVCYSGIAASAFGDTLSTSGSCTSATVGYPLDITFFGDDVSSTLTDAVKDLSGSLVLNAIACGLAGICLICAFFAYLIGSRLLEILTFAMLALGQLVAWLAFWLDLALALISDDTHGVFKGHLGNAIWIALGGAIALTLADMFACCGTFGRYSSHYERGGAAPGTAKPYGRRYLGPATTYRGTY